MLTYIALTLLSIAVGDVLTAPARFNGARDGASNLSARNFHWQCSQGQSFIGNPPPSSDPGSCTPCLAGTFSPDGVHCYTTPLGFYNNKGGAFNPIGCAAGTYSDTLGQAVECKTCPLPLISYAAFVNCVACAEGFTSTDGQYCTQCPVGSTSTEGAVCSTADVL